MNNLLKILFPILILIGITACREIPSGPKTDLFKQITTPPFDGTIFMSPDIITSSDPTTFVEITATGQESRQMFDRRVDGWTTLDAYLFRAFYDDQLEVEIQVNPEFGSVDQAFAEAKTFAPVIGRLPSSLRHEVETVWIHKGVALFGGGNNNLLIHTGQAKLYIDDGILEETLVHEAAHTSLDAVHANSKAWQKAQKLDGNFISTYARDNSIKEDIAESYLCYLAIKYRSERLSRDLKQKILTTIPHRIKYFQDQAFIMYPIE